MKSPAAIVCAVVLTTACAEAEHAPRASASDMLFEAVSPAALAVVDAAAQKTDRRLPLGTPSPDWRHLYSILETSLVDTDPRTGTTQRAVRLGGVYTLPAATASGVPGGLSPNGRWLVVEASGGRGTRMLVIDTLSLTVARRVDLTGQFGFDAISDSGTNLYLIQRLGGRDYYVRLYDLASGALTDNIVVDKSDGNQAMTGVRLSGLAAAGDDWLFSVYVRDHDAPFIHALSLAGPFAFCLDLPGAGVAGDPRQGGWALAMADGGGQLFAVNAATGVVAVASTGADGAPAVTRSVRFDGQVPTAGSDGRPGAAVVAGATLVAGGPAGIVWIDAATLKVVARSLPGWAIAGLGLSPDGKSLYAVSAEGRVAVISLSGRQVTGMFDPSAGTPISLMRVAAA